MSLSGSFFNAINRTNILRNMYERVNIYCAGPTRGAVEFKISF